MITSLLHIFILLSIFVFVLNIFLNKKAAIAISKVAIIIVGLHLIASIAFVIYWLFIGQLTLDARDIILFKSGGYEFFIDFAFDKITATYLLVGSFLTFLITIYCSYYLHRESSYKRFFNTILFFYIGYNITIFCGNLETLFIVCEILGISSFLLIAFYCESYLSVKNALKVFSIY